LHILLARNYWQMDVCGRRRQAVHGSVNIYSPDASVRGSASLVAFSNRSHCVRTPGSARTCSSRGSWISMCPPIVTDDAALQKRAPRSRRLCACADDLRRCPGRWMHCRGSGPRRACALPEHELLPRDTVLEPRLYPLEGRQAGRFAAEIGIAH